MEYILILIYDTMDNSHTTTYSTGSPLRLTIAPPTGGLIIFPSASLALGARLAALAFSWARRRAGETMIIWLVVHRLPFWKRLKFVHWDEKNPNMIGKIKNVKIQDSALEIDLFIFLLSARGSFLHPRAMTALTTTPRRHGHDTTAQVGLKPGESTIEP